MSAPGVGNGNSVVAPRTGRSVLQLRGAVVVCGNLLLRGVEWGLHGDP